MNQLNNAILVLNCLLAIGLTKCNADVIRVDSSSVGTLVKENNFDVLVDVRSSSAYQLNRLPGAVKISDVPEVCFSSEIKIGVYCYTGWDRSTPAAYYLESKITDGGNKKVYDLGGWQYFQNHEVEKGAPTYTKEILAKICTNKVNSAASTSPSTTTIKKNNGSSITSPAATTPTTTSTTTSTPSLTTTTPAVLPPLLPENEDPSKATGKEANGDTLHSEPLADGATKRDEQSPDDTKYYATVFRIDPKEGAKLANENAFDIVVDVRTSDEYKKGHLPGAIHGFDSLTDNCKDKYIGVYCWHGWDRSSPAALYLVSQGFQHVYDIGGLQYMGNPDLSKSDETNPTCSGPSKAKVHLLKAAKPRKMPNNIADGRKGCDGMINSGKKRDSCKICGGKMVDTSSCPQSNTDEDKAIRKEQEDKGESDTIIVWCAVGSALILFLSLASCYCQSKKKNLINNRNISYNNKKQKENTKSCIKKINMGDDLHNINGKNVQTFNIYSKETATKKNASKNITLVRNSLQSGQEPEINFNVIRAPSSCVSPMIRPATKPPAAFMKPPPPPPPTRRKKIELSIE